MSYGYGGRQNPYDQRNGGGNPGYGGGNGGYGGNSYSQGQQIAGNSYGSNNVEMSSLNQSAGGGAGGGNLLNECQDINREIDTIDQNLNQMKMLQQRSLSAADTTGNSRQLDSLSSETMALYRALTERVRTLKSNPASQQPMNAPQVGRVDRRLKAAIQSYQQLESSFRKNTQDQMARQYRIVRPDASEQEVQAAVEDPTGGQVFQQALMQSNRRGQAQSVLSAVQDRHAQLQKIEQQIIELAQLFQDMDTLVVQQEVSINNIESKAEETVENFDKAHEELNTAVDIARKTRRKKWMCLGIVVLIIIIIIAVIIIYLAVTGKLGGGSKSSSSTTTTSN